jgi:RHS repeat-associated protein
VPKFFYYIRFTLIFIAYFSSILVYEAAGQGRPGGGGGSTSSIDLNPALEWDKRSEVGERLTALGTDLLGDSIDPHMGGLSFNHTDIVLPGNSALPVQLSRSLSQGYYHSFSENVEFGDWKYDVPRLSLVTAFQSASQSSQWGGSRCTDPQSTFVQKMYSGGASINPSNWAVPVDYSNGLLLEVPGQGSQHVLTKSTTVSLPFPTAAKYVTPQGWYLTCGTASDGGQGFIAYAPNGDKYKFTKYLEFNYRNLGAVTPDGGNAGSSRLIGRRHTMLMATEVTDVHGNWVKYQYDGSGRLTKIHSNDLRSITLSYSGSSKVVSSATANGRTWQYNYTTANIADIKVGEYGTNKKILSSVTRPDGTAWSFNLLTMHNRPSSGTYCTNPGGGMNLTHPNGVTGTFYVKEKKHRHGYAEWMTETTRRCSGAFSNPAQPTLYDIYHAPIEIMSVTQKTISGPSIPTSQWNYTYESDVVETRYPTGHQYAGHPIATSGDDPTNWTKVLNSDGSETVYYHFWNLLLVPNVNPEFSGKLDHQETKASAGGTTVESVEYDYVSAGMFGGSYLPKIYPGSGVVIDVISPSSSGSSIQIGKLVQKRDGDTFTTEYKYNTTQSSSSYSYGKPIQTKVYSNVSTTPQLTDTVYEYNTAKWILNLTKTVTVNSRLTDTYNYNSFGKPFTHYKYGIKVGEFEYYTSGNSNGALKTFTNSLNQDTDLLNWKRGKPQQIKRADNTSVYQYVDNNGWLTSVVDARNNTTSFSRDDMGRLTNIYLPGSWDDTSISYAFSVNGATQTINKGQSRVTVTYDNMFRPILERTQAVDTNWSAYVNTEYDALGRTVFKSQPSTSSITNAGTASTYDALGRILTQTETVTPFAKIRHEYRSSHRHRIYDPSNAYTDYYSYGYQGAGNEDYRKIFNSLGINTSFTKNVWGELTHVRQWGTQNGYTVDETQKYYYNNTRRVCRHYTPETGATKYQYDNLGQVVAYAKGQSNSGCAVPTSNARVNLSYDLLGRPKNTTFNDPNTPNILSSYDPDGNLESVNRDGIIWTYSYNNISAIENETLELDGISYAIDYEYNDSGNLTKKTLPSGRKINYTPDGLGRVLTVKNYTSILASGTHFHASGQVSNMNLGNGHVFTQTLNARLLPLRLYTKKGSTYAIDQTYDYDSRLNVKTITDAVVSGNNRINTYDAMSRLLTASGPWGSGAFKYDAIGNLRKKTLGSRIINTSYNGNNRLVQSSDSGLTGTRNFGYDPRGNVISAGNLNFVYDYSDQPVSISGTANGYGAASGTYTYDGNLKRVKSNINGKLTHSIYDISGKLVQTKVIANTNNPTELTEYIEGANGTLARLTNGIVTYLHNDILGSPQSGSSASGSISWKQQYSPFGEEIQSNSGNDDKAGFTGHIKDSDTGLNYMQARYYDPVIGRFYSNDPLGFRDVHSFNRYAYANNNPYKFTDPTGKSSLIISPKINVVTRISPVAQGVRTSLANSQKTAVSQTPKQQFQQATNQIKSNMQESVKNSKPEVRQPSLKEAVDPKTSTTSGNIMEAIKHVIKNAGDFFGSEAGATLQTTPENGGGMFDGMDDDTKRVIMELNTVIPNSQNNPLHEKTPAA